MRHSSAVIMPLVASIVVVLMAVIVAAQTEPPGAAMDWVINNDCTEIDGRNIHLDGNLIVNNSSKLVLRNLTITMDPPEDHATQIFVDESSTLQMSNVVVRSFDDEKHYWFVIRGVANITGCDISDVASSNASRNAYDAIVGGVQIYDSNSTLTDSDFHDCERINAYVSGASPTISGCDFFGSEYLFTGYEFPDVHHARKHIYLWLDATGLFLTRANPVIERCNFWDNGRVSSVMPQLITTLDYVGSCYVETWGRGILAHDSSPVIRNCTFSDNGLQPQDPENRWRVFFQDGTTLATDFPMEGGLASVGPASNPLVEFCTFDGNNLFGILCNGGVPKAIRNTSIESTHNWRYIGSEFTLLSPSGAIYIRTIGGRTTLLEDIEVQSNMVLSNVYIEGATAVIRRYSNKVNVAEGGRNVELGQGVYSIENSTLDGSGLGGGRPLRFNIYCSNKARIRSNVTIRDSSLLGAAHVIYSTSKSLVRFHNSSLTATGSGAFFLDSGDVDCIDCDRVHPARIVGDPSSGMSRVRIMFNAAFDVRWQNGAPVNTTYLVIENATMKMLYGHFMNESGRIGPLLLPTKVLQSVGGVSTSIINTPLSAVAYSNGLQSDRHWIALDAKPAGAFEISVHDDREPELHIFSPTEGSGQNSKVQTISGVCMDIGSGVEVIDIQVDGGAWLRVNGIDAWSFSIELDEGQHKIEVRAKDRAGTVAYRTVGSFFIDLTPPHLEVINPRVEETYVNMPNYTFRGVTSETQRLTVNGVTVAVTPDGTWGFTEALNSGSNVFLIRAVDWVGNAIEVVKTVVRDSTIPKLILTSPVDGAYTNISQVELKGITEAGATIHVNGDPMPTFSGRFAATLSLIEGPNVITVDAVDKAGNLMRVVRTVVLDTVPPSLRIESPQGNGVVYDQTLQIWGDLDDLTLDSIVVNGLLVPVMDGSFWKTFRLREGLNNITIDVWDKAQNHASRTFRITLDTTPPMLLVTEPAGDVVTREGVLQLRGRVEAGVVFTIVGVPKAIDMDLLTRIEDTFRWTDYTLRPGLNTLTFEAVDAVGNVARIVRTVHYDLVPPELILWALPQFTADEVVTVSGMVRDGKSVTINQRNVCIDPDGSFSHTVRLLRGHNSIWVKATDEIGNEASDLLNITRVEEPARSIGVLDSGMGVTVALFASMLVLGLVILYVIQRVTQVWKSSQSTPGASPGTNLREPNVEPPPTNRARRGARRGKGPRRSS